jgi:hypothetical protein
MNVRKVVERLLDSIDTDYLQGLGSIVLSSQAQLARKQRRKKFLSRGQKLPVTRILGFYQQSWKGQPAFIELYVDKILVSVPGFLLHVPIVGFMTIGKVLFHELGHHIHKTTRPEFKEREDVADKWSRELLKIAVLKRYRYAMPFLRPAVKVLAPPVDWFTSYLNRKYKQRESRRS